jgi:hypothetical protein
VAALDRVFDGLENLAKHVEQLIEAVLEQNERLERLEKKVDEIAAKMTTPSG